MHGYLSEIRFGAGEHVLTTGGKKFYPHTVTLKGHYDFIVKTNSHHRKNNLKGQYLYFDQGSRDSLTFLRKELNTSKFGN